MTGGLSIRENKMKVSAKAKFLKRVIREAKPVAAKARVYAVRDKIAILVRGGQVEVFAANLDEVLTLWDVAGSVYNDDFELVPAEEGFCVVSITDILPAKEFGNNADVLIEKDKDAIVFSSNGTIFKARAEDPTEYPDAEFLRTPDAERTDIDVCDVAPFKFVQLAESLDTTRIKFTGVSIEDGHAIATDGHRLHLCQVKTATSVSFNGILSPSIIGYIASGHVGRLSEVRGGCTWHVVEGDGFSFRSKSINGQFPDFRKVIPHYRDNEICEIDGDALIKCIKPLFAGLKYAPALGMYNADNGTSFFAWGKVGKKSPQTEPRKGFLKDLRLPKLPIGIGLNPNFIIDALSAPVEGAVQLCAIDADSPVWIGDAERENGAVIMPIQLPVFGMPDDTE